MFLRTFETQVNRCSSQWQFLGMCSAVTRRCTNLVSFSDDDVEDTHPVDGNDSDYDPKKEAKKEVMILRSPGACYGRLTIKTDDLALCINGVKEA